MVGLIANNFIRIYHKVNRSSSSCSNADSKSDVTVEAAILSLRHSFIVDNYGCGDDYGQLHVDGAIAQKYRGPVGTGTGGSINTGFLKDYTYDDRLRFRSPPYFLARSTRPGPCCAATSRSRRANARAGSLRDLQRPDRPVRVQQADRVGRQLVGEQLEQRRRVRVDRLDLELAQLDAVDLVALDRQADGVAHRRLEAAVRPTCTRREGALDLRARGVRRGDASAASSDDGFGSGATPAASAVRAMRTARTIRSRRPIIRRD